MNERFLDQDRTVRRPFQRGTEHGAPGLRYRWSVSAGRDVITEGETRRRHVPARGRQGPGQQVHGAQGNRLAGAGSRKHGQDPGRTRRTASSPFFGGRWPCSTGTSVRPRVTCLTDCHFLRIDRERFFAFSLAAHPAIGVKLVTVLARRLARVVRKNNVGPGQTDHGPGTGAEPPGSSRQMRTERPRGRPGEPSPDGAPRPPGRILRRGKLSVRSLSAFLTPCPVSWRFRAAKGLCCDGISARQPLSALARFVKKISTSRTPLSSWLYRCR